MIVRNLQDCNNSERAVDGGNWRSVRMLLRDDNMGFSFHITTIRANTETFIHYKNHLEAVYCIAGDGEVETLDDGVIHAIRPGILYVLDKHDRHLLRAREEMQLACVFNPPLTGKEVHGEDGAYPVDVDHGVAE